MTNQTVAAVWQMLAMGLAGTYRQKNFINTGFGEAVFVMFFQANSFHVSNLLPAFPSSGGQMS